MHCLIDTPTDSSCFLRDVSYLATVLSSFFPSMYRPCISYSLKLSLVLEAYANILNIFFCMEMAHPEIHI